MRMLIPVQNFLPSRLASPLPFQYQSRFESSFVERDGISSNSFFQGIPSGHYGLESARSIGEWHERIRFSQSAKPQAKPTLASRPPNSAQEKNSLLRGRLRPILLPHKTQRNRRHELELVETYRKTTVKSNTLFTPNHVLHE